MTASPTRRRGKPSRMKCGTHRQSLPRALPRPAQRVCLWLPSSDVRDADAASPPVYPHRAAARSGAKLLVALPFLVPLLLPVLKLMSSVPYANMILFFAVYLGVVNKCVWLDGRCQGAWVGGWVGDNERPADCVVFL